ncbi:MAG: hypothetical protein ACLUS6_12840 [Dysosmobacter sp.]
MTSGSASAGASADVVLGTRSAIFAPAENLGLIVVDEEQEGSVPVGKRAPVRMPGRLPNTSAPGTSAALVLGSATPDGWSPPGAAEQGSYQKALLRRRYNGRPLPEVLDRGHDGRRSVSGNAGPDQQRAAAAGAGENLAAGRAEHPVSEPPGSSRYAAVRGVAATMCLVSPVAAWRMTYHSANGRLMCHYCGHSELAADTCPGLRRHRMKHVGAGTQQVEERAAGSVPGRRACCGWTQTPPPAVMTADSARPV